VIFNAVGTLENKKVELDVSCLYIVWSFPIIFSVLTATRLTQMEVLMCSKQLGPKARMRLLDTSNQW